MSRLHCWFCSRICLVALFACFCLLATLLARSCLLLTSCSFPPTLVARLLRIVTRLLARVARLLLRVARRLPVVARLLAPRVLLHCLSLRLGPLAHHVPELAEAELVVARLVELLEGRLNLLLVQIFAHLFELLGKSMKTWYKM